MKNVIVPTFCIIGLSPCAVAYNLTAQVHSVTSTTLLSTNKIICSTEDCAQKLRLLTDQNDPTSFDQSLESCVTGGNYTLTIKCDLGDTYVVHAEGFKSIRLQDTIGPKSFCRVANVSPISLGLQCGTATTVYPAFAMTNSAGSDWGSILAVASVPIDLTPSDKTCSATVNDVNLGELSIDSSRNYTMSTSFSGDSKGTVRFSSTDLQSDGRLHLGGDPNTVVVPSDPNHIESDTGAWTSSTDDNGITLVTTTNASSTTGEHTSNVTATLTCE